jgi:hypothetical protein
MSHNWKYTVYVNGQPFAHATTRREADQVAHEYDGEVVVRNPPGGASPHTARRRPSKKAKTATQMTLGFGGPLQSRIEKHAAEKEHTRKLVHARTARSKRGTIRYQSVAAPTPPYRSNIEVKDAGNEVEVFIDKGPDWSRIWGVIGRAAGDTGKPTKKRNSWMVLKRDWPSVGRDLLDVPGLDPANIEALNKKLQYENQSAHKLARTSRYVPLVMQPGVKLLPWDEDGESIPGGYQEEGIRFLMARTTALLGDDMGLGKTLQAIVAADNAPGIKRDQILVLCPPSVVQNWATEIVKFVGKSVYVIRSTTDVPPIRTRFVVCGYAAGFYSTGTVKPWLLGQEWGLTILDEAHSAKKPKTLIHGLVHRLDTKRLWLLTGTPVPNLPIDLFGQLRLGRHELGQNRDQFMKRYGKRITSPLTGDTNFDELADRMSGWLMRRTKAEELADLLPDKIIHEVPVEVAHKFLRGSRNRKIGEVSRAMGDLAQAKAKGTWEFALKVIKAGKGKRDWKGPNGRKIVLFSGYNAPLDYFRKQARKAGLEYVEVRGEVTDSDLREVAKRLFQGESLFIEEVDEAGNIVLNDRLLKKAKRKYGADKFNPDGTPKFNVQVFLGNLVSASEGITLTKAQDLIFNDLTYMPSRHLQSEDRVYRVGADKNKDVHIYYMISKSLLDVELWKMIKDKIQNTVDIYEGLGDPEAASQAARAEFHRRLTGKAIKNPSHNPYEQWRHRVMATKFE